MRSASAIGFCIALWLPMFTAGAAANESGAPAQLVAHMHDHLEAVAKMQTAIIDGDLTGIREPAQWMLEHPAPAGTQAGWDSYLKSLRSAARSALEAKSFMAAATAMSQMGVACGDCHISNGVTVQFERVPEPGEEFDTAAHMQRHVWSANRMWEGLIGPSEDAWGRGADLLFEAPLSPDKLVHDQEDVAQVRLMARRIHQLAANATMEFEAAGQAKVYAEFLATCASCHTILEKRPGRQVIR